MRVIRLFVKQSLALNNQLELDDTARHHAINVLRLNTHSSLILFNGDGYDYRCEMLTLSKKTVVVKIVAQISASKESILQINLLLGVSKSSHMDYTIQKAVEAGANNIYPVVTAHTIAKLSATTNRRRHWQQIIISACEQCGRATLPVLQDINDFGCLDILSNDEYGFIFDPAAKQSLAKFKQNDITSVCLLVGPEGGFTQDEIKEAGSKGYQTVSCGPRVLRTETAALTAMVCAQLLWGDLSAPQN